MERYSVDMPGIAKDGKGWPGWWWVSSEALWSAVLRKGAWGGLPSPLPGVFSVSHDSFSVRLKSSPFPSNWGLQIVYNHDAP